MSMRGADYCMKKFEFYLSDKDFDRLFYLKNRVEGKNDMTGNEYAADLLERELYRLCPKVPREYYCDEDNYEGDTDHRGDCHYCDNYLAAEGYCKHCMHSV